MHDKFNCITDSFGRKCHGIYLKESKCGQDHKVDCYTLTVECWSKVMQNKAAALYSLAEIKEHT